MAALESLAETKEKPQVFKDDVIFHAPESRVPFWYKRLWLQRYIKREFGLIVPGVVLIEGHNSPLDFIADIVFEKQTNALAVGNRDGGKTFDLAIIHAINSRFYDSCETLSVGAVETQALKCYGYYTQFIKSSSFAHLYEIPQTKKSLLKNGSSVQFIPGTINALNSPHPHVAVFDELELADRAALEEFYSMTKSDEHTGKKAVNIFASTRKYSYGVVQQTMDEILSGQKPGWKLYLWSIWEVASPFELQEEWKDIKKRDASGTEHSFYNVAAPYAGKTEGFYPIHDIVNKFSSMAYATWVAQWECKKPSSEGLVYGAEFDRDRDVLTTNWQYDDRYLTFTGQDFGDTNPMAKIYYQLIDDDEGIRKLGEDPETIMHLGQGKGMIVAFKEIYINKISASNFAKTYVIPNDLKYRTSRAACDPSGAGFKREMEEAEDDQGRRVCYMTGVKLTVEQGIQLVKTMHEQHRIKYSPCCVETLREKGAYHYLPGTDKPAKEDDHTQDAERYAIWMMFSKEVDPKAPAPVMPMLLGVARQ